MLTLQSKFFSYLDANHVPLEQRGPLISYLLASCLSACTPVPSSPVDAPRRHYMEMYSEVNISKIAAVNEQIVLDFEVVSKLTFDLWLMRYRLVHEPRHVDVQAFLSALVSAGNGLVPQQYSTVLQAIDSDKLQAMRGIFDLALVANGDAA